jgi:hypothetical protein
MGMIKFLTRNEGRKKGGIMNEITKRAQENEKTSAKEGELIPYFWKLHGIMEKSTYIIYIYSIKN